MVEAAEGVRDLRVMSDFGIDEIELGSDDVGADISVEKLTLLTREDVYAGLQQALPPGLRG